MKFAIILSWSKLVAVLILGAAVYLDLQNGGINAFMFSLPFITGLIVGKQAFDKKKNNA